MLDRTGLILEIFGRRARTREGTLQVEHAHLTYQKGRLVRTWTHLERQRGGFGFLGGPGETQIETDRRLLGERIDVIRKELQQVSRTRALHRKSRQRVPDRVRRHEGDRVPNAGLLGADLERPVVGPGGQEISYQLFVAPARCIASRASACLIPPWLWSATPMPANRPCSIR